MGARPPVPPRDAASDHRRLLVRLSSRALRLGSQDAQNAAQETLKRALENCLARPAVEYYFGDAAPSDSAVPEWPLDQLLAWMHAVLRNVVREEHGRVSSRNEVAMDPERSAQAPDRGPDPLVELLRKELRGIVAGCFSKLDPHYRAVLRMRDDGLKYAEIAARLGVNENTVATWVSRGMRELARSVRRRTERGAR